MVPTPTRTKKRLIVAFVLICLLCSGMTFRVGWVQIVNGEELSKIAADQQTRDVPIAAKRGAIYDRNGKVLAMSAATFSVWARPAQVRSTKNNDEALSAVQVNNAATEIALITGMEQEKVKELLTQEKALIKVAKHVDKEAADRIREKRLRGIEIAEETKRYYPLGVFAAHTIGSVTDDNNGLYGVELRYNGCLRGVPGRWIKNADTIGNGIAYGVEKYYGAENGLNVVLTIDEVIQHYVEKALVEVMEATLADRVLCVMMEPKTGDILAMAVLPDFDPNNPRVPLDPEEAARLEEMTDDGKMEYWNAMWRNPIVNEVFEPGSTFKLLTTAMALEENVTHMHDGFVCKGSHSVSGIPLRCWRSSNPHGSQNLIEAVANSCNPAFIQLAQRLGENRFYQYLDLFGISEKTRVDFPGEARPILQNKASAGPVGLATMAYGQGISVTPLQLLTAVCCLGNEGKLMQPRLVKALTDSDGNIVAEFGVNAVRQAVSKQTAQEICFIMEAAIPATAKISGHKVGGKTGTASKLTGGNYEAGQTDSSFIGMAPMDDPKVAVLLVVDNPKGTQYGSLTAAPGVKKILIDTLRYLNIEPDYTQEELKQIHMGATAVPDITGVSFSDAAVILTAAALEYTVSPAHDSGEDFIVIDQYPKAGEKIATCGTVYIYKE